MLGRDRKKNKKYLSIVSNGGEAAINAKSRAKSISGYPCALFPPSTRQRNVNATRFCL